VEVYPLSRYGRVRNVQAYHQDAEEAFAGQRVALNLQGIDRDEIERGTIIGRKESLLLTERVDATLRYLKLPLKPIKTDSVVRFHVATTQVESRLVILGKDTIEPGEQAFVQFVFSRPIVALPGDNFVVRGSYAIQTIGGGTILDVAPFRHRRKSPDLAATYRTLTLGSLLEKMEYHIMKGGFEGLRTARLALLLGMEEKALGPYLQELADLNRARVLGRIVLHGRRFEEYRTKLLALLEEFHRLNPQKTGISREELRSRLPKAETVTFQTALEDGVREGIVEVEKDRVRSKGFGTTVNSERSMLEEKILKGLTSAGLTPPSVKELAIEFGTKEAPLKDALERLVFEGKLVKVKGEIYFHRDVMEEVRNQVVTFLGQHGKMAPSDFKGIINVSRKYMIPILEYFDEIKLTIRTGETRILRAL
jgi:selenocysteine-specific elongation factor